MVSSVSAGKMGVPGNMVPSASTFVDTSFGLMWHSDGAILNLVEASTIAFFMATALVTKHLGFQEEWHVTTQMFHEYNQRPAEVPD